MIKCRSKWHLNCFQSSQPSNIYKCTKQYCHKLFVCLFENILMFLKEIVILLVKKGIWIWRRVESDTWTGLEGGEGRDKCQNYIIISKIKKNRCSSYCQHDLCNLEILMNILVLIFKMPYVVYMNKNMDLALLICSKSLKV